MPKPHPKKPHEKGVGAKLVAPAKGFIKLFVNDPKEKVWAEDQIHNEGPEHKQVLNAVLLQQVAALVKAVEAKTGLPFQLQPGETVVSHKHDDVTIPVPYPLTAVSDTSKEAVLDTIAKAPEHELLMYAMLQQIASWATNALAQAS